jgi:hypothetical protein
LISPYCLFIKIKQKQTDMLMCVSSAVTYPTRRLEISIAADITVIGRTLEQN